MKKFLLLSFAALLLAGNCPAQTPPHSASTQTWTFGNQVWSDAIQIPECNKTDFTESDETPDCLSYTFVETIRYYYNWSYVNANKNTLCPAPWRVPTLEDFEVLLQHTTTTTLMDAWKLESDDSCWTTTASGSQNAYYWAYVCADMGIVNGRRYDDMRVRCVR
jgi:uncharacterized protein (TIGR02145 family)